MTGRRFRSVGTKRSVRSLHATGRVMTSFRLPGYWLLTFVVLATLIGALRLMEVKVRPVVLATGQAIAARAATDALNEALTEQLAVEGDMPPLVQVERDRAGDLSVARFNFGAIAQLQSLVTRRANDDLLKLSRETFRLPVGEVVGGSLFGAVGPQLPVRFTLIGHAQGSVHAQAKTIGINQSVHEVDLELTATVRVLTPLTAAPTTVHAVLPVAYIVFGGSVPNTYLYNSPQHP